MKHLNTETAETLLELVEDNEDPGHHDAVARVGGYVQATTELPFRWLVEIEVDPLWVGDGFELTADRLEDMLSRELSSARAGEYAGRILSAPDPARVRCVQGYPDDDERKEP